MDNKTYQIAMEHGETLKNHTRFNKELLLDYIAKDHKQRKELYATRDMEELAELSVAISKLYRCNDPLDVHPCMINVIEEIADVLITIDILCRNNNIDQSTLDNMVAFKIHKVINELEKE